MLDHLLTLPPFRAQPNIRLFSEYPNFSVICKSPKTLSGLSNQPSLIGSPRTPKKCSVDPSETVIWRSGRLKVLRETCHFLTEKHLIVVQEQSEPLRSESVTTTRKP